MQGVEVTYRCFTSKRKFGIELEVEKNKTQAEITAAIQAVTEKPVESTSGHWAQSTHNDYWHIKYDSTCGPKGKGKDKGGWEVASYVASGYKDLLDIEKTTDALCELGCKVNDNCGLHIHADVSDFTKNQISILIAYWLKVEKWLSQAVPSIRADNKYCKLLAKSKAKELKTDVEYEPLGLWDLVKPTNFAVHENNQKKTSLNLVGIAQRFHYEDQGAGIPCGVRQTVELRMPEGTLDGREVVNWVRLFLLFVETSKTAKMPNNIAPAGSVEELLRIIGFVDPKRFYLLSKGLHETKTWLLKRIRRHGTHRAKRQATDKLKFITT